jgi:hypothetical protein
VRRDGTIATSSNEYAWRPRLARPISISGMGPSLSVPGDRTG